MHHLDGPVRKRDIVDIGVHLFDSDRPPLHMLPDRAEECLVGNSITKLLAITIENGYAT